MSENVKNQKSFHEPCGIAWPFECRPEPNECDPTKELCDGKRKDNVLDPPNWFMDSVNRYEKHGKEKKGYVLEPGANQSRFGGSMVLACRKCGKSAWNGAKTGAAVGRAVGGWKGAAVGAGAGAAAGGAAAAVRNHPEAAARVARETSKGNVETTSKTGKQ